MKKTTRSATRVTAENWRDICPCQRHARRRLGLRGRGRQVLLFAGSLLIAGASVPLDALETAVRVSGEPGVVAAQTARMISAEREKAIAQILPAEISFSGAVQLPSPLRIERIREEFFRTQIPFGELIYREAKRHGLEPELVAAVVQTESDFRPRLISSKDAQGLMQVLPSTAQELGFADPMDPVQNIRAGTRYLKYLQDEFDDPALVLAAYNAGPSRVKKLGAIPPFRETREYLVRVDRSKKQFQRKIAERLATIQ